MNLEIEHFTVSTNYYQVAKQCNLLKFDNNDKDSITNIIFRIYWIY